MIQEFRVSLVLCVNVPCEEGVTIDEARAVASIAVDEIRQTIPCDSWTDGMPQTIAEIASGKNPITSIENLQKEKIKTYRGYLEMLGDELLDYEFNDRGLDDGIYRERLLKQEMLIDWVDSILCDDPTYIPDHEYKPKKVEWPL